MTPYELGILKKMLSWNLPYVDIKVSGGRFTVKIDCIENPAMRWIDLLGRVLDVPEHEIRIDRMSNVFYLISFPIPKEYATPRIEIKEVIERLEQNANNYGLGLLMEVREMGKQEFSDVSDNPESINQIWKARHMANKNNDWDIAVLLIVREGGSRIHVERLDYAMERKSKAASEPLEEPTPGGGKLFYYNNEYRMICPLHDDGVECVMEKQPASNGAPPYLQCWKCEATGPLPVGMIYPKDKEADNND